jgi:hypothetical protein
MRTCRAAERLAPVIRKSRHLLLVGALAITGICHAQPWHPLPSQARFHAGADDGAQDPAYDDSQWGTIDLSSAGAVAPEEAAAAWLRVTIAIPQAEIGHDVILRLGDATDMRSVFLNGAKIAGGFGTDGAEMYLAPANLVHFGGDNLLSIQIAEPAGWAGLRGGKPGWTRLDLAAADMLARALETSSRLEAIFGANGAGACDFILGGDRVRNLDTLNRRLQSEPSPELSWQIASSWRRIREIALDPARRARDSGLLNGGDCLGFMQNQEAYLVPDFSGEPLRRPALGSELSDFGSWYDIAYSGGTDRFMVGSVRKGVGPDHEFFNTARDLGILALFVRDASGGIIDGSDGDSTVTWYPFGCATTTRNGSLRIDSAVFFTSFDTISVYGKVVNTGAAPTTVTPQLLVTLRSEYDGKTGGRVTGARVAGGLASLSNLRVGTATTRELYSDTLVIGSSLGALDAQFLPKYLASARGAELRAAVAGPRWSGALDASCGTAELSAGVVGLSPGQSREFVFVVAAAALGGDAGPRCAGALRRYSADPGLALKEARDDWNGFLRGLPSLEHPTYSEVKLYYSAAIALRKNRYLLQQENGLHSASFPARGGFNYFYQSDSCWNLLGYLDFKPEWAEGHAVPILVPPCEIMDPHFFWSMWELYSRLPDDGERKRFAAMVYPLLKEAYRVWTTKLDVDSDLLVATPNNWDDNPRYDLIFKEVKYAPGWNSWWDDLVRCCRDNALDDPAPSSQLGYGAVVLGRLARILGLEDEAQHWDSQLQRHIKAIDSLWDQDRGQWIVTYRGTQRDDVLTSSIIYPIFTDLCRDPAKISRVIEGHLLNPLEFNGHYPVPTVAYDDPRFYHQKPPFDKLAGGLWRGNLWMPEAWIIVKGLYKYGYEAEARGMAGRLAEMMAHQSASVGPMHQFDYSPAEWYDSRTGLAQNNRAFSWSSAVALDLLLGNYQNERVVGTNGGRDMAIDGHIREIYSFATGRSIFRVWPAGPVFPELRMNSADGLSIDASRRVEFVFTDPAGNFANRPIAFSIDRAKWKAVRGSDGAALPVGEDGECHVALGSSVILLPPKH